MAERASSAYFRRIGLHWILLLTVVIGLHTPGTGLSSLLNCTWPGQARGMAGRASSSYFRRAGLHWMLFAFLVIGLHTWTVFWPKQVPYQNLGPIGSFVKYLVDFHYQWLYCGYWTIWVLHLGEALYGLKLCSAKGITDGGTRFLWALQTFLFGIFSLSLLMAYKPAPSKKHK